MNDLRFAARMLARRPGFALAAVGLLAAGIGGNAVLFGAFEAVLLRKLPVRQPEQLLRIVQKTPQLGTRSQFHYSFYRMLMERSTTLSGVFASEDRVVALNEPAPAQQLRVQVVTPEYFDVLGVPALLGRTLNAGDAKDQPGAPPAVLSYGFWQSRFNGDRAVIGRMIVLHKNRFIIAGVMPRNFNGISIDTTPDVRIPLRAFPLITDLGPNSRGGDRYLNALDLDISVRMKPGVTAAQAQAEITAIWPVSLEAYYADPAVSRFGGTPQEELGRKLELDPLERGVSVLRDRYGRALTLSVLSSGLLLAMVCLNLAGLLVSRGAARRQEIAARLALGATRARLVRQLLTESFLIAGLGAVGGIAIAFLATPLLVRGLPSFRDFDLNALKLSAVIEPNQRVLLFSIAVAVLTALLFGLTPAILASRTSLDSVLRSARSSGSWRGRQSMIAMQAALCTLLLSIAGLFVRTFEQLHGTNPGFDRDHLVAFTVNPELAAYSNAQARALRLELTRRVRELPGVVAAANAVIPVMRGSGMKMTVAPVGQRTTPADFLNTSLNSVSDEYFDTMGIRVLEGRGFTHSDDPAAKPIKAVVNQAFARRFFPNTDALGQRFGNTPRKGGVAEPSYVIIGVVSDAKYRSLREPTPPTVYGTLTEEASLIQEPSLFQLYVRTRERPASLIQPVRLALAVLDPALPFVEVHTLSEEIDASTAGERLTAGLASAFGGLAAVLAAVGVYALLAYAVGRRRREIGVRMALGASAGDIGALLVRQALIPAVAGVLLGLGAALAAGPWFKALLFDISPSDPRSLLGAAICVICAAVAASITPITRAMRVQPAEALREDN